MIATQSDFTLHTKALDTTPHYMEFRRMDSLIESYKAYLIPKRTRMRMRMRMRMKMRTRIRTSEDGAVYRSMIQMESLRHSFASVQLPLKQDCADPQVLSSKMPPAPDIRRDSLCIVLGARMSSPCLTSLHRSITLPYLPFAQTSL